MVPDAVKPLLNEFESLADSFWDPERGADFASWLATDADDLHAGRITLLLLGGAEDLASFLRADDPAGLAKRVGAGAPTLLLDTRGADISSELRRVTAADAWPWKLGASEPHRVLAHDDVPLRMDRVRLIVMAGTQLNDASPSLVALLRHHVDAVVVAHCADADALASVAATLGDVPALVLTAAGSAEINSHEMDHRRCVRLEVDEVNGIGAAVHVALSGVLPLLVTHRCKRWIGEWRRELQIEAERLGDVLKVRESELARRTSPARPGEKSADDLWRSAQFLATDRLTQLEKELQANTLKLSSEQVVGTLRDADLDWGEATIDGRRPLESVKRMSRWLRREISVRVGLECLNRIERRLAQATLRQLKDDHQRILSAVQSIEKEVEDRVRQISGRDSLPPPLRLPSYNMQSRSVVDGISVSAGGDEKLVRLGALDIVKQAYSGVNGIVAIVMSLIVLGGGALMWQQSKGVKQLPAVLAIVLAAVLGNIVVQWRRAPRHEATAEQEKTQALSARLIASTAAAARACASRRDDLHDEYLKTVSGELSKYFRSLDTALKQRAAQAASDQQDSTRAALTHIARRVALMQSAVSRAERCIDALADPADAAYRRLTGDRTSRPPVLRPQRPVARHDAAVPSTPSVAPARSANLRQDTPRVSFPGRDTLAKSLRARGQN
jgi:hypothetical protein